jgi:hypothetical protein
MNTLKFKLPSSVAGSIAYGSSIKAYQDKVLIGSPLHNSSRGLVQFRYYTNDWVDGGTITPSFAPNLTPIQQAEAVLQANDNFGHAITINNGAKTRAIISAINRSKPGIDQRCGQLFYYEFINNVWTLKEWNIAPLLFLTGVEFGYALDSDDQILVSSARFYNNGQGIVVVYKYNAINDKYDEIQEIQPNDVQNNDNFGESVSLYKNFLIVSSPNKSASSGAVYVYLRQEDNTFIQFQKLLSNTPAPNNRFGQSVNIYENVLVVGVPNAGAGQVETFRLFLDEITDTKQFEYATTLVSTEFLPGDNFGSYVKMGGRYLLVSAPNYNSNQGLLVIYEKISESFVERALLTNNEIANGDHFSIPEINQNFILVGSPNRTVDGNPNAGQVYYGILLNVVQPFIGVNFFIKI